ncbi:MAG: hypothetical protein JSS53_00075 [Proteobacteria bacterium]|nr:hypothetical protein [Pseudomonadota bacterium]
MKQVVHKRKIFPSNRQLELLVALSELLEADTTCVAVCFSDVFIITSNFSSSKTSTDILRQYLDKITNKVFSHLRMLVEIKKRDLKNAIEILSNILNEHLKSMGCKKVIKDIISKNIFRLVQYVYQEYLAIQQYIVIGEDGELVKDRFIEHFRQSFPEIISSNIKVENITIVFDEVCRMCRALLILEESVLTQENDKQMPTSMLQALQSEVAYRILPNTNLAHAEMAIIEELLLIPSVPTSNYSIGISKICCPHCTLLISALHSLSIFSSGSYFYTKGSHCAHNEWKMPEFMFKDTKIFSAFLGGGGSLLHKVFVELTPAEKFLAFRIIQSIYAISEKIENLKKILCRETPLHLRSPYPIDDFDAKFLSRKSGFSLRGWIFKYFEGIDNCFFLAVSDQLKKIKHKFVKQASSGAPLHHRLRLFVQGAEFKDGEQADITKLIREFNLVIAIVDLRQPELKFFYHVINVQGKPEVMEKIECLAEKKVIKIAYTGSCYLSVKADPLNLLSVVKAYSITGNCVKHGLFAEKLPRDLRTINEELVRIDSESEATKNAMLSIIEISERMGSRHPISIEAKKYYQQYVYEEGKQRQQFRS